MRNRALKVCLIIALKVCVIISYRTCSSGSYLALKMNEMRTCYGL